MQFFRPQIEVIRQAQGTDGDRYFIHVVTFCNRTSYQAGSHRFVRDEEGEGLLVVEVDLLHNPSNHDFELVTPVVHTIDISEEMASGQFPEVEVRAFQVPLSIPQLSALGRNGQETNKKKEKKKLVGKGKSSTATASGDNRGPV